MSDKFYDIGVAATMLGQKICGVVPHAQAVFVVCVDQKRRAYELWVDVDNPKALQSRAIPANYGKFEVHKDLNARARFSPEKITVAITFPGRSKPRGRHAQRPNHIL